MRPPRELNRRISAKPLGDVAVSARRASQFLERAARTFAQGDTLGREDLERGPSAVGALADRRAAWLQSGSRMSGDVHVRFCERLGVRFPGPTHRVMRAREWTAELTAWVESKLEGKFGLEINRDKTRVVEVKPGGGSLDFLGYTFCWDRDRKGGTQQYLNVFPAGKSVAREREKLRELTEVRQSHTPLPYLVERLNRQLQGWANYFSYGYPRGAWWEIDWFVRSRLMGHLQRRSQRPYRPPQSIGWYEHIQSLGLVLLNRLPGKRPAHA